MVDYNKWQKISPENCVKCKFGTKVDKSYCKGHCSFQKPKTRFIQGKGWVCREYQENI